MKTTPPTWAVRTKADALAIEQGCYWDNGKANQVCKFAEAFFKSQYITGPFKLLQWQRQLLQSLYGWRRADGSRRFRFANLHCAKKVGKTMLVAIVSCFELFCSGQPSPFICVAAASKENASQVFSEMRFTIEHGPLGEHATITPHTKKIEVPSMNGKLWTLASDGKRIHGYQPNLVVFDEAHATRDVEMYRALRYATIARKGLMFVISTAGNDTNHWYHAIYLKSKKVLAGDDLDTSFYAEVHESDPDADLENDTGQWYKACPSLGISYSEDDYRRELQAAKSEGIGAWLNFQQLMGNRWVRPDQTAWLDVADFAKYERPMEDADLAKFPCFAGVDLSETVCPSSCSLVFDMGNRNYYVKSKAWVCEGAIEHRERSQLPKYQTFTDLTFTEGDMLDRNSVLDHIIELGKKYDIRQVNFDPRSAYVLMNDVANQGFEVARFVQSPRNFNGPMVEFERAWKEGRIFHDGSAWLKYCLSNVRVEVNKYGEVAPRANKSVDHIDGAVAALLAFHEVVTPEDTVKTGAVWL